MKTALNAFSICVIKHSCMHLVMYLVNNVTLIKYSTTCCTLVTYLFLHSPQLVKRVRLVWVTNPPPDHLSRKHQWQPYEKTATTQKQWAQHRLKRSVNMNWLAHGICEFHTDATLNESPRRRRETAAPLTDKQIL